MSDAEWVNKEITYYQAEEIANEERVKKAEAGFAAAKAELAAAVEGLKGTRGGLKEMLWQKKHLESYGRLP